MRAKAVRVLRVVALATLSLLFVLFAFAQVPQAIFHHQVVRLLADAQAIELHKSTWADAQALMHRWGRWGHYDGRCTADGCEYEIEIRDLLLSAYTDSPDWLRASLRWFFAGSPAYYLGLRSGTLSISIIVQDGVIIRKSVNANLYVPEHAGGPADHSPYTLMAASVSVQRPMRYNDFYDGEARYAREPYYSAVRPGGCTFCMSVTILYSHATPPAVVRQISAVRTECYAAFAHCVTVVDLLPAVEPFHLYEARPAVPPAQAATRPAAPRGLFDPNLGPNSRFRAHTAGTDDPQSSLLSRRPSLSSDQYSSRGARCLERHRDSAR